MGVQTPRHHGMRGPPVANWEDFPWSAYAQDDVHVKEVVSAAGYTFLLLGAALPEK